MLNAIINPFQVAVKEILPINKRRKGSLIIGAETHKMQRHTSQRTRVDTRNWKIQRVDYLLETPLKSCPHLDFSLVLVLPNF